MDLGKRYDGDISEIIFTSYLELRLTLGYNSNAAGTVSCQTYQLLFLWVP